MKAIPVEANVRVALAEGLTALIGSDVLGELFGADACVLDPEHATPATSNPTQQADNAALRITASMTPAARVGFVEPAVDPQNCSVRFDGTHRRIVAQFD